MTNLHEEIIKFQSFFKSQKLGNVGNGILHELGPFIYKYTPKNLNKTTRVGFLGLTHGDEMIGLPILNSLLEQIATGYLHTNFEIFFALGNLPAALENRRYINQDLNRSFGLANTAGSLSDSTGNLGTSEKIRAKQLEILMLDECDYLIDFHQTIQPTKTPFVIFQYASPRCLQLMKLFDPGIPVILQQEAIGSSGGLSTDEYVRKNGGFGFAVELGQKCALQEISRENLNLGLAISLNMIDAINKSTGEIQNSSVESDSLSFPLFVMGSSYKVKNHTTSLYPGFENFQKIIQGDILGQSNEKNILAEEDSFILFPKYSEPILPGQELFYTCKRVYFDHIEQFRAQPS